MLMLRPDLLATTSNWNVPTGSTDGNHAVSVYYTSVALNPAKAILSVTLPTNSNMHIFALGLNSLQQAYNNVGISDNSNPTAGNFDGFGYSYSAQALSAAGMTPGSLVSHNGVLFTWPNVAAGQADNVTASGQTLTISGSGAFWLFWAQLLQECKVERQRLPIPMEPRRPLP